MKKVSTTLLSLYLLSMFLPAGVQPDREKFGYITPNYFPVIDAHKLLYSILVITLMDCLGHQKEVCQLQYDSKLALFAQFYLDNSQASRF